MYFTKMYNHSHSKIIVPEQPNKWYKSADKNVDDDNFIINIKCMLIHRI